MKYDSVVNFVQINVEAFEVTSITGPAFMNMTQSQTDDDKTVRIFCQGIDLDVKLIGSVSYLWKRSVTFQHMKIRNLTINWAMTPDWFLKGVYSSMEDFDLVVEEPLIARALYNNHELLLDQINKQVASYIPTIM